MMISVFHRAAFAALLVFAGQVSAQAIVEDLMPYQVRKNHQENISDSPTWIQPSGEGMRWAKYDQFDERWQLIDLGSNGAQLRSANVILGGDESAFEFAHYGDETTLVGEFVADNTDACRIVRVGPQLETLFSAQHQAGPGDCRLADVLADGRTVSYVNTGGSGQSGRYFLTSSDGQSTSMRNVAVPEGYWLRRIAGNGEQLVVFATSLISPVPTLFAGGFSPDNGELLWSRTIEIPAGISSVRPQRSGSEVWLVLSHANDDLQIARFNSQGMMGDASPRFFGALGLSDIEFVFGPGFGGVLALTESLDSKLFGWRNGAWMQLTVPRFSPDLIVESDGFRLLRNVRNGGFTPANVFLEKRDWTGSLIQQRTLPGFFFASHMRLSANAILVFGTDIFINGLGQPVEGFASCAKLSSAGEYTAPRGLTAEADFPSLSLQQQYENSLYFVEDQPQGQTILQTDLAGRTQAELSLRGDLIHVDSRGIWTLEQSAGGLLRLYSQSGALLQESPVPTTSVYTGLRSDAEGMWLLSSASDGSRLIRITSEGTVISQQSRPPFSGFAGNAGDTYATVEGELIRVDPNGVELFRRPDLYGRERRRFLPDGDLLVATGQGFLRINRLGSTVWSTPSTDAARLGGWAGNAYDSDWVWVASSSSSGVSSTRVTRINTVSGEVIRSELTPGLRLRGFIHTFDSRGGLVAELEDGLAVFKDERLVKILRLPRVVNPFPFPQVWFDDVKRLFVSYPSVDGELVRTIFANDEGFFAGFER